MRVYNVGDKLIPQADVHMGLETEMGLLLETDGTHYKRAEYYARPTFATLLYPSRLVTPISNTTQNVCSTVPGEKTSQRPAEGLPLHGHHVP